MEALVEIAHGIEEMARLGEEQMARAERFKVALQAISRVVNERRAVALEADSALDGWELSDRIVDEIAKAYRVGL